MTRLCCKRYEELRAHLKTLTPDVPTPEQKAAVEALAELIEHADNAHMESSWR